MPRRLAEPSAPPAVEGGRPLTRGTADSQIRRSPRPQGVGMIRRDGGLAAGRTMEAVPAVGVGPPTPSKGLGRMARALVDHRSTRSVRRLPPPSHLSSSLSERPRKGWPRMNRRGRTASGPNSRATRSLLQSSAQTAMPPYRVGYLPTAMCQREMCRTAAWRTALVGECPKRPQTPRER